MSRKPHVKKTKAGKPRRRSRAAPGVSLDPVTLEVIRNALPAVANEMAADLQRTSYNMMIYEVRDFCTALVDPKGQLDLAERRRRFALRRRPWRHHHRRHEALWHGRIRAGRRHHHQSSGASPASTSTISSFTCRTFTAASF